MVAPVGSGSRVGQGRRRPCPAWSPASLAGSCEVHHFDQMVARCTEPLGHFPDGDRRVAPGVAEVHQHPQAQIGKVRELHGK